jgi:hypothetical protein
VPFSIVGVNFLIVAVIIGIKTVYISLTSLSVHPRREIGLVGVFFMKMPSSVVNY